MTYLYNNEDSYLISKEPFKEKKSGENTYTVEHNTLIFSYVQSKNKKNIMTFLDKENLKHNLLAVDLLARNL